LPDDPESRSQTADELHETFEMSGAARRARDAVAALAAGMLTALISAVAAKAAAGGSRTGSYS
jgi:hypothetical protein